MAEKKRPMWQPTPEPSPEVIAAKRTWAKQALENLKVAQKSVRAAEQTYWEALKYANHAQLPGGYAEKPSDPEKPGRQWQGAVYETEEEMGQRFQATQRLGVEVNKLKRSIERFLRETGGTE